MGHSEYTYKKPDVLDMQCLPPHSTLKNGKLLADYLAPQPLPLPPSVHTAVHTRLTGGKWKEMKKEKENKNLHLRKNKESRTCWSLHHHCNAKTNTPPPRPLGGHAGSVTQKTVMNFNRSVCGVCLWYCLLWGVVFFFLPKLFQRTNIKSGAGF